MANHKSAAKRARQTNRRRERNLGTKRTIRTFEKNLRTAISNKDDESVKDLLKKFTSKISKAANKGILHKNSAARKVARLTRQADSI